MRHPVAKLDYGAPLSGSSEHEPWVIDGISDSPNYIYNFAIDTRDVLVTDLRKASKNITLEQNGFELTTISSKVDQNDLFSKHDHAVLAYQQEIKSLLYKQLNFDDIIFFDTTVRCEHTSHESQSGVLKSHPRVHADQNPNSAYQRAKPYLALDKRFGRFQIINFWRPLFKAVRNHHIALCDYQTIDPHADLVDTQLVFPPWLKDKENYSLKFNKNHKWYYWSALTPNEALVFKCFDSSSKVLQNKIAPFKSRVLSDISGVCPHTSFFDEDGPKVGMLRSSIEVRAMVFYEE
ncbi:CmcJ/NvfI family oxidoreductase [Pseudoalteromonas umbrosa]|uniref:CmcJ/NvfI family oxidoreductase n=1 Tax=Pseudoalteromonas umbrosa TaxID=3048489 RepID=UPI0024C22426|nr:CmcJ/NvfI family oxidoreductase [Pseudoalteromonas sp. B95]MDK1288232.1 CmcJ/NvfI family oxidoreductase [Pseudoalteromonas sp. B95]